MRIRRVLSIVMAAGCLLLPMAGNLKAQALRQNWHPTPRREAGNLPFNSTTHEPLGARLFRSSGHTWNRCCLPPYDYGHDDPRSAASVVAQALPIDETEVTWLRTEGLNLERQDSGGDEWPVQHKRFHFPASSLTVDAIQLDQVGLSLYRTGHLLATGKVLHSGGPYGNLSGNRAILRIRAYAGPSEKDAPLVDAPILWQHEHRFWARRGRRLAVTFAPEAAQPALRRHYSEITHVEVELVQIGDR